MSHEHFFFPLKEKEVTELEESRYAVFAQGWSHCLSDGLCDRVEKTPQSVWKTLVNRVISRKGSGIKEGTTLGKVMNELIEDDEIGDVVLVTIKKEKYKVVWTRFLSVVIVLVDECSTKRASSRGPTTSFKLPKLFGTLRPSTRCRSTT